MTLFLRFYRSGAMPSGSQHDSILTAAFGDLLPALGSFGGHRRCCQEADHYSTTHHPPAGSAHAPLPNSAMVGLGRASARFRFEVSAACGGSGQRHPTLPTFRAQRRKAILLKATGCEGACDRSQLLSFSWIVALSIGQCGRGGVSRFNFGWLVPGSMCCLALPGGNRVASRESPCPGTLFGRP